MLNEVRTCSLLRSTQKRRKVEETDFVELFVFECVFQLVFQFVFRFVVL